MYTRVHFVNLERSEALENIVTERVHHALERYFGNRADLAQVDISLILASGSGPGLRRFCCELEVRTPRFPRVFVKKQDENVYRAVSYAIDGLKNAFAHARGRRRPRYGRNFIGSLAAEARGSFSQGPSV